MFTFISLLLGKVTTTSHNNDVFWNAYLLWTF